MGEECYESYAGWMVILSSILSISTYIIGAYILYGLRIIFAVLYYFYYNSFFRQKFIYQIFTCKYSCRRNWAVQQLNFLAK